MAKVLVIGSTNMDVVTPLRRMPAPDETIHVDYVTLVPGGKGANATVAAARLGAEVRFVGCVGDDMFGVQLRETPLGRGDRHATALHGDRPHGHSRYPVRACERQNAIMVGPGANAEVQALDDRDWYVWSDNLMLQLETPMATAVQAAWRARKQGTMVLLDPAPASADLPVELLAAVDIMVPNESELATLTGRPAGSMEQIVEAARSLIAEMRVGQVVVTLGGRGVLWTTPDTTQHIEAVELDVVDTAAAGDTFAGALAVSLASRDAMSKALAFAATAGALACTRLGAQPSIPNHQAVLDRLVLKHRCSST